jgi:hypothetical protein
VIAARIPPTYEPERRYALEVVLGEFLGLPVEVETAAVAQTELRLAGEPGELLLPEGLFATPPDAWLRAESLPGAPAEVDGVPVLYGSADAPDLLGSAFFLLTRYEELARPERDAHDRFPFAASVASTHGLLERPVVDEWVELLRARLEALWPRLATRRHAFAVVPSHDVDAPLASGSRLRGAAAELVRRRDPRAAVRRLALGPRAYDTFDWTMEQSERRGLRSAFYFICGHTGGAVDGDYTLADPWIRRLLRRVHERGHEIGLHPSYGTFRDPDALRAEADALRRALAELGIEQEAIGGRQHFLRWENPVTWRAWADAGLAYDSTLGFSEQPGFRCGTCREYPVFDLRARERLALRERPLVAMDVSVLQHMGLGERAAGPVFARAREACRRVGGSFTLLWHNNHLASPRQRAAYLDALGPSSRS